MLMMMMMMMTVTINTVILPSRVVDLLSKSFFAIIHICRWQEDVCFLDVIALRCNFARGRGVKSATSRDS